MLIGCGVNRQPGVVVGRAPSWRSFPRSTSTTTLFAPLGAGAVAYSVAPTEPTHDAIETEVAAYVRELAASSGRRIVVDGRLSDAMDALAPLAARDELVHATVDFALRHVGLVEPAPFMFVVQPRSVANVISQTEGRLLQVLAGMSHVRLGVGSDSLSNTLVIALSEIAVTMDDIPRRVGADASIAIRGKLHAPFGRPTVIVSRSDGTTNTLQAGAPDGIHIDAAFACAAARGKHQLEIIGHDASGATVLANFPIWCGEAPPAAHRAIASDGVSVEDPDAAEKTLLSKLNAERAGLGLAPLQWDPAVARVARGHSYDMHATGNVGHVSLTTGSAADRVRRAGIQTGLVMENVARAYAVSEAHDALLNSPGHRANMLSPQATHVGIGVVLGARVGGRRELFVTQLFTRVPPILDVTAAANLIHRKLRGLRAIQRGSALERAAQSMAAELALGRSADLAWRQVTPLAQSGMYAQIESTTTIVADIESVAAGDLLGRTLANEAGVGVAQGDHREFGRHAIWIVVLLGRR